MGTNDPIGRMFKRGQLRRETDRAGKAAEARLKAARMWQSIYADLPGAQLSLEKRKAAQAMSRPLLASTPHEKSLSWSRGLGIGISRNSSECNPLRFPSSAKD